MIKKRKSTTFIKKMPEDAGRVVGMCEYKGCIYIAAEFGVFYLTGAKRKNRLQRCKFIQEKKI